MKKIWNFLKEVEWKKEFTTWTGFVGRAWNWIWGIYMLFLAGINFYLAIVDHYLYASVAIWQLFAVLMWFLFNSMIKMQKDSRMTYRKIIDLQDEHIEDLRGMVRSRDDELIKLRQSNATGTQV